MKRFLIFPALCFLAFYAGAQDVKTIKIKTDSLISAFETALKDQKYEFKEMISNPDNFFADEEGEITGDTIMLGDYEYFKFYRTKRKDGLFKAEYYKGRIGQLFEKEIFTYFFVDGKLKMTLSNFVKHGESLDDYGVYTFVEERRLLFDGKYGSYPLYIMRDGEGQSESFDINNLAFRMIASDRIIYDKYTFEIIGEKIFKGQTDF
jgi:hypothetical protein